MVNSMQKMNIASLDWKFYTLLYIETHFILSETPYVFKRHFFANDNILLLIQKSIKNIIENNIQYINWYLIFHYPSIEEPTKGFFDKENILFTDALHFNKLLFIHKYTSYIDWKLMRNIKYDIEKIFDYFKSIYVVDSYILLSELHAVEKYLLMHVKDK